MNKSIVTSFVLSSLFLSACGAQNGAGTATAASENDSSGLSASAGPGTASSATASGPASAVDAATAAPKDSSAQNAAGSASATASATASSPGNVQDSTAGTVNGTSNVASGAAADVGALKSDGNGSATKDGNAAMPSDGNTIATPKRYAFFRGRSLLLPVVPDTYIFPSIIVFTENANFCADLANNAVKANSTDIMLYVDNAQNGLCTNEPARLSSYTRTKKPYGNPGDFRCGYNKLDGNETSIDANAVATISNLDKNISRVSVKIESKLMDSKLLESLPKEATLCGPLFEVWPVVNARAGSNNGQLSCID